MKRLNIMWLAKLSIALVLAHIVFALLMVVIDSWSVIDISSFAAKLFLTSFAASFGLFLVGLIVILLMEE